QSWAGPTTVTGGGPGTLLVDTSSDTSNWMDGYTAGSSSTPLYFRFTLTVNDNTGETGGGGFFTGFQLYGATIEHLAVGNNWTSVNWGGYFGPGDFQLNANAGAGGVNPISPGETASFVLKLTQSTGTAVVWFNPNLGVPEAAQDTGLTTTLTGLGANAAFDNIRIRAGNGTGSTTFSAMSVQTDSPFAVPEPSGVLLAGLAGMVMASRRQRQPF
ncbi:MAG TPA: PEP-CTERM sorting domain-containing protein, partial [Verrucomicrobiales bacterium]|nr:PEP-CTERM sorting domain-containing protein [Verrucomicrobiales bacterium]